MVVVNFTESFTAIFPEYRLLTLPTVAIMFDGVEHKFLCWLLFCELLKMLYHWNGILIFKIVGVWRVTIIATQYQTWQFIKISNILENCTTVVAFRTSAFHEFGSEIFYNPTSSFSFFSLCLKSVSIAFASMLVGYLLYYNTLTIFQTWFTFFLWWLSWFKFSTSLPRK
jgi:hypothetical protein